MVLCCAHRELELGEQDAVLDWRGYGRQHTLAMARAHPASALHLGSQHFDRAHPGLAAARQSAAPHRTRRQSRVVGKTQRRCDCLDGARQLDSVQQTPRCRDRKPRASLTPYKREGDEKQ